MTALFRSLLSTGVLVALMALSGCSSTPPIKVPATAQLIWHGAPSSTDFDFGSVMPVEGEGQIYLVDATTGRVLGVRTVWPEHRHFNITGPPVNMDHEYSLYFASKAAPCTQP